MVICENCRHSYTKQEGSSAYTSCKKGCLFNDGVFARSCSGFEEKGETMEEVKTENSKIKAIKVHNGTLRCVGDIMQLEGEFEIEYENREDK